MEQLEDINCPFCNKNEFKIWGKENDFDAVKCENCGFIYVNPRPNSNYISKSVLTGKHSFNKHFSNVITRRIESKVEMYYKIFITIFSDIWKQKKTIKWLDVGAGFGEIIESVQLLATKDSIVKGIEPMDPKAQDAISRGLNVQLGYLENVIEKFNIISLINVFSHLPDFRTILGEIKDRLEPHGEIFIETGNAADCNRDEIPGVLSLPDHLVFAGEKHMVSYLEEFGFEIILIKKIRIDTLGKFIKNCIKVLLGKPIILKLPYTSNYRSLQIRAKLKS